MTAVHHSWTGVCTRCRERVTVDVLASDGRTLPVDLDPARFVCLQCREPKPARQLELGATPEPDVFGHGRVEQIPYPPDMVRIPF